jgi:hypothetical protein
MRSSGILGRHEGDVLHLAVGERDFVANVLLIVDEVPAALQQGFVARESLDELRDIVVGRPFE